MEDVLSVYTLPYDPRYPQVCMDELSKQVVAETRTPLPATPGQPERYDYEYERQGVANLFLFTEPLQGSRWIAVTERRIPDIEALRTEVAAWQDERNAASRRVHWRFTTEDARIKLKRLYPSFQE
jgi:hypothetical protein